VSSSWQELLGLPSTAKSPDLYQVLGLDRHRFDSKLVDKAFAERLKRVEAIKDPKAKALVARAREELLCARRVLKSPEARAVYEEDLKKKDRSPPLVGRTIDEKYEIVAELGAGAMGTVF
jgi:hypothetical protein